MIQPFKHTFPKPISKYQPAAKGKVSIGRTEPYLPWINNIELDLEEQLHAMVVGRAGSGKSKLLQSRFLSGFYKGETVGIVEPHHDLSFDTLTYLIGEGEYEDKEMYHKLVYLDFGNGSYIPLNILSGNKDDVHTIGLNALDAMTRVFPELEQAPMFQTLFLSAITTLIMNELPLTYLYKLITDADFRQMCLDRVSDPVVKDAFAWYSQMKPAEQAIQAGSLIRRAFLLMYNPITRYCLSQPDCIDFRKMMDQGISFIINLGNINDKQTRKLVGAIVMVLIEQAALSRTDMLPKDRRPLTLLVDEWTSYAAQEETISTVLSQCRKYNLRMWLANQSLSQIPAGRLIGAMENCRLTIVFGVGRHSAEIESKQIGAVDPMMVKEEGLTDTQHAQYVSIQEQFEAWTQELANLDPRMAYCKLHNKPAVRFKTLNIKEVDVDSKKIREVLENYKRLYQRSEFQIADIRSKIQTEMPIYTPDSFAWPLKEQDLEEQEIDS